MNLQQRLDEMIGRSFLINTREHRIVRYRFNDDSVEIVTDKKTFEFSCDEVEKEIAEFLPIGNDKVDALELLPKKNELVELKATIMENIKKVKRDKAYIPQANSINSSINTLINMAKLDITFMKLMNGN